MYEKNGLMVKVSNPMVLAYLRSSEGKTHTDLVESALLQKMGLPPKQEAAMKRGGLKKKDCRNVVPVKIRDRKIIDFIIYMKVVHGVSHRHTVESAILALIAEEA